MAKQQKVRIAMPQDRGQIKEVDVEALLKMPVQEFYMLQNFIVGAELKRYYDKIVFDNAEAITAAHATTLFTAGVGDSARVVNTGAEYKKTLFHTNMRSDGEFHKNSLVFAYRFAVRVDVPSTAPVTSGASATYNEDTAPGQIIRPTFNPAVTTYSASQLHKALSEQTYLKFLRDQQPINEGLIREFPPVDGRHAVIGNVNDGFVQSGFVPNLEGNKLRRPEMFEGNDQFSFELLPLTEPFLDLSLIGGYTVIELEMYTLTLQRVYA